MAIIFMIIFIFVGSIDDSSISGAAILSFIITAFLGGMLLPWYGSDNKSDIKSEAEWKRWLEK